MSVTSTLKPSRCSRELVHVSTDLGDDRLGGHLVDAGNPVQERDECKKRLQLLVDAPIVVGDHPVKELDVRAVLSEQEPMMVGHPAVQRLFQLFAFGLQPSARQRGQLLRILLAVDDRPHHVPARLAHHVGCDRGQLDVGVLQDLVDAIDHRAALAHQAPPSARQIAQLTNRSGRNEAAPHQPVLEQLR